MIAWNLATRGGSFLRISNCILLMFSVVKKWSIFGNQFSFHNSDPKMWLTYCFFDRYPLMFVVILPFFETLPPLFSWMFIWAAISYQLQEYPYIESGWTLYSYQWLPEIWQLVGGPFCEFQIAFCLMFSVVKKWSIFGNQFSFHQFRSKNYWRIVCFAGIRWHPLFSSYPCFFFFLRCLFGLPSVISCRSPNTYIESWMTFVSTMIAWNLATRGGVLFANFKLHSLV